FTTMCRRGEITQSMARDGSCFDKRRSRSVLLLVGMGNTVPHRVPQPTTRQSRRARTLLRALITPTADAPTTAKHPPRTTKPKQHKPQRATLHETEGTTVPPAGAIEVMRE